MFKYLVIATVVSYGLGFLLTNPIALVLFLQSLVGL